jgi:predicted RNA-binding Zn-ribbon protein involved in translation (DUF1610 family)
MTGSEKIRYTVKKNLAGAYSVKFDCPQCGVRLSESLKRAGHTDTCPDCGTAFVTPGKAELAAYTAKQERIEAEKAESRVAAQQERANAKAQKEAQRAQQVRKKKEAASASNAYEPPNIVPEPKSPRPTKVSTTESRYPALTIYRLLLLVIGYLVIGIGVLSLIVSIIAAIRAEESALSVASLVSGFASLVSLLGMGGILVIASELIKVVLDIEANTRRANPPE